MIREAEGKDAIAVERLYQELLPNHSGIHVLPERLEEIRINPNSYLFVYDVDGSLVGTAHLHVCLDALSGTRPFGVVERVIVTQEMQGRGYGSRLMEHLEEVCKEKNCVKVFLTSNALRQDAHQFYDKLGYDGEGSKAFKKYL
ncbi:GNAT family N-acetyltransferase [Paenibacillus sp. MER 99-2]|uniref:GNAT family N-acetyltransferase n=1 Tax=Paenibacillus sp. MER 99-2 TaxID=2939572 RepID=UPI00203ECF9C|nr:GNAT family N-acetyltransferase [Paenibacillus sp. MER 99-2]MCM3170717.1 GNAT family N-acetyltransferase [Paenibacillus sp. MER 99-2]